MGDRNTEMEFEAVILVIRGDEMPKKNYEKKLHPTYEVIHDDKFGLLNVV